MVGVDCGVLLPFFRQVIESEDRRNWANRDACAAINAFHRIYVQLRLLAKLGLFIFARMDAINRAGIHTRSVFDSDARLCNYVCHRLFLQINCEIERYRRKWVARTVRRHGCTWLQNLSYFSMANAAGPVGSRRRQVSRGYDAIQPLAPDVSRSLNGRWRCSSNQMESRP